MTAFENPDGVNLNKTEELFEWANTLSEHFGSKCTGCEEHACHELVEKTAMVLMTLTMQSHDPDNPTPSEIHKAVDSTEYAKATKDTLRNLFMRVYHLPQRSPTTEELAPMTTPDFTEISWAP